MALKVLTAGDEHARKQLVREAKALERLAGRTGQAIADWEAAARLAPRLEAEVRQRVLRAR